MRLLIRCFFFIINFVLQNINKNKYMSVIFETKNVKTTGKIEVKKGFASLGFLTDKPITGNELITIKVQRKLGVKEIYNDIPLTAVYALGTMSKYDAIQYSPSFGYYAVIELTEGSPVHPNISLNGLDNEVITIEITNLSEAISYKIFALESPMDSLDHNEELLKIYHRVLAPTTKNENIDTRGFDALLLERSETLKTIVLTYDSNKRIERDVQELDLVSASADPIQFIEKQGDVIVPTAINTKYVPICLEGVISIECNKTPSDKAVNVFMRIDEGDADYYNVK